MGANVNKPVEGIPGSSGLKTFSCADAGKDCSWKTQGKTDEEILKNVEEHAKESHKDVKFDQDTKEKVRSMIKSDEEKSQNVA